MSLRKRFFAATYDGLMRRSEKAGLTDMRIALVARAEGTVLEIGAGTGGNLDHYRPAATSLTLTEPDVYMFKRLERRAQAVAPSALVLRAPAEDLPFEDGTFDTIVSTLVLCGVDDQPPGRFARSAESCAPEDDSCSWNTSALTTRQRPRSRTR